MKTEEAITNYIVPAIKRTWNDKICKEILEALEQEPSNEMVSRGVFEQVMWERNVAINQLKELGYGLGEKPKTGHWIPVSERLPEYGEAVITVNSDDDYEINHIIDDDLNEWFYDGVIAWMPLPEPMQADKETHKMTNSDLFQSIFGIYATELWSKPEAEFLEWLNSECKYPQRKTGHWIESRCDMYECSECDHIYTDLSGERYGMHYCPNCGCRMVEP